MLDFLLFLSSMQFLKPVNFANFFKKGGIGVIRLRK